MAREEAWRTCLTHYMTLSLDATGLFVSLELAT